MSITLWIIYFIFCLLVAYVGRNVAVGFWGILVMSILFTPLLIALLSVLLKPKSNNVKQLDYLDEA